MEQAFLPAMTAFLRAFLRNAGTKAGMAASKGRSTFEGAGMANRRYGFQPNPAIM